MEYNLYTGPDKNNITDNYFNINNNSSLAKLKDEELEFLLSSLNYVKLPLRNSLNLRENNTFGIEIEYNNWDMKSMHPQIHNFMSIMKENNIKSWTSEKDKTIEDGHELISPILRDRKEDWKYLKDACEFLRSTKSFVSDNTAGHIHVGAQIMNNGIINWINLLKVWAVYENIIYRFSYGENCGPRELMQSYGNGIRNFIVKEKLKMEKSKSFKELFDITHTGADCDSRKAYGINFRRVCGNQYCEDNTIEIRCPNGTLMPAIWQNNINFFIKLLTAINSEKFDMDYINKKLSKLEQLDVRRYYLLDIRMALKLIDIIFDNNTDKIYALKQYYKDGDQSGLFSRKIKLV